MYFNSKEFLTKEGINTATVIITAMLHLYLYFWVAQSSHEAEHILKWKKEKRKMKS